MFFGLQGNRRCRYDLYSKRRRTFSLPVPVYFMQGGETCGCVVSATKVELTFHESEKEGSRRGSHGFHSLNLQLRASHDLLCLQKYGSYILLKFWFA